MRIPHPSRALLRELLLTAAALAGVVCLLATVAAFGFGIRPLVFRSGSMSPAIPTGALALAQETPAAELVTGDVVSVVDARGTRLSHRIVALQPLPAGALLTLKGDANETPDAEPYPVDRADRIFWSVPRLGYLVAALSSRYAVFGAGAAGGALVVYALIGSAGPPPNDDLTARPVRRPPPASTIDRPERAHRRADAAPRRSGRVRPVVVGCVLVGLAGPLTGQSEPTAAAFQDTSRATSGPLTTYAVPLPPTLACTGGLGAVTFTWAAQTVPLNLIFRMGTETAVVALPAGQSRYTLTPTLLGTGTGTAQLRRSDTYPSTTWSSAGNTRSFSMFLGLLSSCS